MWTDKCFRLILNTKLFESMQIDKANKKTIRFNAYDEGTIRIFIIKVSLALRTCYGLEIKLYLLKFNMKVWPPE